MNDIIDDGDSISDQLRSMLGSGLKCPLCARTEIHEHSPLEIIIYRNGMKYGRRNSVNIDPDELTALRKDADSLMAMCSLLEKCRREKERLTAELKRVQELHTGLMKNADDRCDALNAELAAAKKDSRRLDYMQNTCLAADFDYGERHECVWVFRLPEHIAIGVNVRKNIDAALTDTPAGPLHSERKP